MGPSRAVSQIPRLLADAEASLSRTNQRLCSACKKPFWAWSTGKTMCLSCEPLSAGGTRATLQAIRQGVIKL